MWIIVLFVSGLFLWLVLWIYENVKIYIRNVYAKKILKKYLNYGDILFSFLDTSKTINITPTNSNIEKEDFTLDYLVTFSCTQLKHILTICPEELDIWRDKLLRLHQLNQSYPLAIYPISINKLVVYRSDIHRWHDKPIVFDDKRLSFWPKQIIDKLITTEESRFELSQSLNSFFGDLDYTIVASSYHSIDIQHLYKTKKDINPAELAKLQAKPFERFHAPFKKDVFEFANRIIREGHGCFYHFTDRSNLISIIENGGLYSWYTLNKKNITSKMGGNSLSHDLDCQKGLEDYVRLGITTNHPMMKRLEESGYNLVLLKIHPIVAMFEGTLFSNINATDRNCKVGGDLSNLTSLVKHAGWRFRLGSYSKNLRTSSIHFKLQQGEVLIPRFLPIRYIMNIYDLAGYNDDYYKQYHYAFYPQISTKIQSKWEIKETRSFNAEEVAYVIKTKVVCCKYGYSLEFLLKNNETRYLPILYSNYKLMDGETIDLSCCTLVVLSSREQKDIVQIIIH